jgi:tape measure domain-containing protein
MADVATIALRIASDVQEAIKGVTDTGKKLDDMAKKVERISRMQMTLNTRPVEKGLEQLNNQFTKLWALAGSAVAFVGIKNLTMSIYEATKASESAFTAFSVMLGGAGAANDALEMIKKSQTKEMFGGGIARREFQQLTIAGFSASDAMRVLEAASNAAAASLDSPTENLHRIILAISQIKTKGKAATQELKLQLGEAGINALQGVASHMGISVGELEKRLEKGEVSARDAITGIVNHINTKFAGMGEAAKGTLAGIEARIKGQTTDTFAALGNVLSKNLKVKELGEGLLSFLKDLETKGSQALNLFFLQLDMLGVNWATLEKGFLRLSYLIQKELLEWAFASAKVQTAFKNMFDTKAARTELFALNTAERVMLGTLEAKYQRLEKAADAAGRAKEIISRKNAVKKDETPLDIMNEPNPLAIQKLEEAWKEVDELGVKLREGSLAAEMFKAKMSGVFDAAQLRVMEQAKLQM